MTEVFKSAVFQLCVWVIILIAWILSLFHDPES